MVDTASTSSISSTSIMIKQPPAKHIRKAAETETVQMAEEFYGSRQHWLVSFSYTSTCNLSVNLHRHINASKVCCHHCAVSAEPSSSLSGAHQASAASDVSRRANPHALLASNPELMERRKALAQSAFVRWVSSHFDVLSSVIIAIEVSPISVDSKLCFLSQPSHRWPTAVSPARVALPTPGHGSAVAARAAHLLSGSKTNFLKPGALAPTAGLSWSLSWCQQQDRLH